MTSSVLTGVSRLMLPNSAKHQKRILLSEVSARHFCLMPYFGLTWSFWSILLAFVLFCITVDCLHAVMQSYHTVSCYYWRFIFSSYTPFISGFVVSSSLCNFSIVVLLEFRAQEGRDPDIDHADADADKLKEIAAELLKSLGIREDWLDLDFTAYVIHSSVLLKQYVQVQLSVACYHIHCHCQP